LHLVGQSAVHVGGEDHLGPGLQDGLHVRLFIDGRRTAGAAGRQVVEFGPALLYGIAAAEESVDGKTTSWINTIKKPRDFASIREATPSWLVVETN